MFKGNWFKEEETWTFYLRQYCSLEIPVGKFILGFTGTTCMTCVISHLTCVLLLSSSKMCDLSLKIFCV